MGNTCCNYSKKDDPNALNFNGKPIKQDPKFDQLMNDAKKNESKIVRLQANWRGFQTRK